MIFNNTTQIKMLEVIYNDYVSSEGDSFMALLSFKTIKNDC